MLFDPARHEALRSLPWDSGRARAAIARIVADTENRFTPDRYWPVHPHDAENESELQQISTSLYFGACGVFWALHYLQSAGAARLSRNYLPECATLLTRNRLWLGASAERERSSLLMGDTPIQMLGFGEERSRERGDELALLIEDNLHHPARELMWGSPGTLLSAFFLYELTGEERWADLFRQIATTLWSQLEWSPQHECHYWTQDLYGKPRTFLDGVHGFVATALPLIRGRALLYADSWSAWQQCLATTVRRTATWNGAEANWRPQLDMPVADGKPLLMQFCHGAPGFVVCLADFPDSSMDGLLLAAGEAVWTAGPLVKGSNLCHGTGGNGYAFLKLYRRTGDPKWLDRARAFAIHGLAQTEADADRYGRLRYSLWTGDLGFAIYLWDCLRAEADFPTLDIFFARTR